jgi:hypothetical protein
VARGFGFGLAGSAAYIVARKGKEVDLPSETGMLVRIDNGVTLPGTIGPVAPAAAEAPAAAPMQPATADTVPDSSDQ